MIHELDNVIQPYAWGSHEALAALRGAPRSDGPEAELWMGAHPLAPSRLSSSGVSLEQHIEHSPATCLGAQTLERYGAKLPFLLKVLAAATPLSLQAHPSLEQAARGFEADDSAGIALNAPNRNYKDRNHKPELLCALGEFWALCGFRDVPVTLQLLDELAVPGLAPYRASLAQQPNAAGLAQVFAALMGGQPERSKQLALETTAACQAQAKKPGRFAAELDWGARIGTLYPGDVGVVSALLLNLLRLEAGQAIYLPAGNLHAYLGGTGVEIMASSDNVLRGGLTPKHVDLPELLRVLDFTPMRAEALTPITLEGEHVYATPAREFRLSFFELTNTPLRVSVAGPEIWLVTEGHAELRGVAGPPVALQRGRSAFVEAGEAELAVSGQGRVFRACSAH